MRFAFYFGFLIIATLTNCVPFAEEPLTEVNIDYNDPEYRSVYNFKDSHQLDSLLEYMDHRDPSYRYAVAMAFSSYREPAGLNILFKLLQDSIREVQTAAAYSLGQIGDPGAENELIRAFVRKDTGTVNNMLNCTILEAIGKCGSESSLESISTVTTYRKQDDLLLLGQARAIYRYGLRGIFLPEGTSRMIELVTDTEFPNSARVVAANYLYRFPQASIEVAKYQISRLFTDDPDPRIRMALAIALGRTGDPQIFATLRQQYNDENDYRVRCNIIRSFGNFPYIDVAQSMLNELSNNNVHIARMAAQYFVENGNSDDAIFYLDYARKDYHWLVKSSIYESILIHIPHFYGNTRTDILNELTGLFEQSDDSYEKAGYLKAIAGDVSFYNQIRDLGLNHEDPIVRTATVESMARILDNPGWEIVNRTSGAKRRVKRDIAQILRDAIESGDVAMIEASANILSTDRYDFQEVVDAVDFLDTVRNELQLPQDVSAINALAEAINTLSGQQQAETQIPGFNNPIDWSIFQGVTDSSTAIISTGKGNITIEFYPKYAPGAIVNFIQLAMNNFYDGKTFHRVVPNFVIQGGCPRGDGYGSLDYTIRSELGPLYYDQEGMVGMASSGNHTESTQFFITHSPAMHLDGEYTLFARVIDGMDIIHDIQVGDQIRDVIISK